MSLAANMARMVSAYNVEAATCQGDEQRLDRDPAKISWSRGLVADALRDIGDPLGVRVLHRPAPA